MPRNATRRSPLLRLLFAIPILGWQLREIHEGKPDALQWFVIGVVCSLAIATLTFGLPGLVMGMLPVVALCMAMIVAFASG